MSHNTKMALIAFVVFDVLVATWLVYLFLLRTEVNEIDELREAGATRYPQPPAIESFALLDDEGEIFTQRNMLGTWSVVFFGFTSCPDVCPVTMTELAQFYRRYKDSGQDNLPQIIFVSVDPERDGVTEVAAYMERFDSDFIGLSGEDPDIADVAEQFFVAYSSDSTAAGHVGHVTPSAQNENYMVSHSVHVSVVNPQGRLHSVIRPPIRSGTMLELYPKLIMD